MIITEYNEDWDNDAKRRYYIEQGRQENQLSVVKNLLALKIPIEVILKATGLSEEQILSLAKTDSGAST